jgi:hypothetical protein
MPRIVVKNFCIAQHAIQPRLAEERNKPRDREALTSGLSLFELLVAVYGAATAALLTSLGKTWWVSGSIEFNSVTIETADYGYMLLHSL